jgi:hypothetical protein
VPGVLLMARLSEPADRDHLQALRALRRAGLDPAVLEITRNDEPDREPKEHR